MIRKIKSFVIGISFLVMALVLSYVILYIGQVLGYVGDLPVP